MKAMLSRLSSLSALILVACGGLGPLPEEIASDLPPSRRLDEAQKVIVAQKTREALTALLAGNHATAARAAEAALRLDPRAARARAVRARVLMEKARKESPPPLASWQRAEGELRLARRLAPKDAVVALLMAQFFEADGHLSAAVAVLDRSLQHHPHDRPSLSMAGRLHFELGEERLAKPLLARLLQRAPEDDAARYRLAWCELRLAEGAPKEERAAGLGRAALAFEDYRHHRPDDIQGYLGEARARARLLTAEAPDAKALAVVLALYSRAAELDPTSPEPDFGKGVVLARVGQEDEARKAYRRALQRQPEHVASLLNLAASLAAENRHEEARALCRRALALPLDGNERHRLEAYLRQKQ